MARFIKYEQCPKCASNGRDTRKDNLAIYSDGSAHCFSNCGYHRFPSHYVPKVDHKEFHATKTLPNDTTREVPAKGWQWLLQYGLSYKYWQPYCGYSEKEDRLIIGVPDLSSASFSVGRFLGTDHERSATGRYLGEPQVGGRGTNRRMEEEVPGRNTRKWKAYGDCHQTAHVFGDYRESKQVVLVEDLISAHKVGRVSACIPLFGTRVFDGVVSTLRHIGLPVSLWLDMDQQGTTQKKAMNLSVLINQPVTYCFTSNDPKLNSLDEITKVLS